MHVLQRKDYLDQFLRFLSQCQHPDGGFCGGNLQSAHTASTYGAVMAIVAIGTPAAYEVIDREKLYAFLLSLKDEKIRGAIRMERNGERDMRSIYCAISVAKILNLLTPELVDGVAEYVART